MPRVISSLISIFFLFSFINTASANEYANELQELAKAAIGDWVQSEQVVSAINTQNKTSAGLDQAKIDSLDKQWRAETKADAKPLINSVLGNSLSAYLKGVKENSEGLYTEIFVMDMKGLNVGQSDVTSDYWQGDEGKWKKTYGAGVGGQLIDDVEFDDSSQTYQSQVSIAIVDPATKAVIGAVTIGVNIEALE